MIDVQASHATKKIKIQKVGVTNVKIPIIWQNDTANIYDIHHSVAMFSLMVELDAHKRGTHMSRFLEVLYDNSPNISINSIWVLCDKLLEKMESKACYIKFNFKYFFNKQAPVTNFNGIAHANVYFNFQIINNKKILKQTVKIPVTSLCPCSKAISEFGAHNQRGVVSITLWDSPHVNIADFVTIAENGGSCAVFPLLKRDDEKYVTEFAFQNPRFVEDMVREIANILTNMPNIKKFEISAENFESIHQHNVLAIISSEDLK